MSIFNKPKTEEKKSVKTSKPSAKKSSMKDLYGDAQTAVKTGKDAKQEAKKSGRAYRILERPLITEKASHLAVQNKYFFAVAQEANKIEITKAVTEVYGITPVAVNIIAMKGKKMRYGRITGKRKDWKKAIVTLPEGKTINIYEGV